MGLKPEARGCSVGWICLVRGSERDETYVRIRLYVGSFAIAAGIAIVGSSPARLPFPGAWELVTFFLITYLLEQTSTQLKAGARGSLSFVMYMSAAILFGGFWGAIVAGSSTAASQLARRNAPIKVVFNIAQVVVSITCALFVYQGLGGGIPPAYLQIGDSIAPSSVQKDLGLFFVFAAIYFLLNSFAVSGAAALSSGRPFREIWTINTRGVLGYDLGASASAILVAWFFHKSQEWWGVGPVGLVVVVIPILVVRHVYGMYHKLQDSGRELLDLMVKAIEARDPYTSGHSIRVATYARAIAREVGLPTKQVEEIYTAALLHDVGKIHEEFAPLLRKETKLTPEETALLQTHAVKSADLVGIISSFRGRVQEAVRSHHERWDGGGYPDGLAAEAIPLGARIIMISDTIDAMSTDRPYRKKLTLDAVVGELQKHSGAQFDPELADLTINSVSVRRVIAEIQASPELEAVHAASKGGSTRVKRRDSGLWNVRRAF